MAPIKKKKKNGRGSCRGVAKRNMRRKESSNSEGKKGKRKTDFGGRRDTEHHKALLDK